MTTWLQILRIVILVCSFQAFSSTQGVYIAPEEISNHPTSVRKTISDRITPLVEVGPSGPTIVEFPGRVVSMAYSNTAYSIKKRRESESVKSPVHFNQVVISVKKDSIGNNHHRKFISENAIKVVVTYLFEQQQYSHQMAIIYRPDRSRSKVTLIQPGQNFEGSETGRLKVTKSILKEFEDNGFTLE